METKQMTVAEWKAEGIGRFGEDQMAWRFKCPICGHVASAKDYKDAGAPVGAVGFSCIGRWIEGSRQAFGGKGQNGPGPCDYAGGGLFKVSPIVVVTPDGGTFRMFDFADE